MWSQLYTPTHRTCRKTSSHTSPNTREHDGPVASWLTVCFLGSSSCQKDVVYSSPLVGILTVFRPCGRGKLRLHRVYRTCVILPPSVWLCAATHLKFLWAQTARNCGSTLLLPTSPKLILLIFASSFPLLPLLLFLHVAPLHSSSTFSSWLVETNQSICNRHVNGGLPIQRERHLIVLFQPSYGEGQSPPRANGEHLSENSEAVLQSCFFGLLCHDLPKPSWLGWVLPRPLKLQVNREKPNKTMVNNLVVMVTAWLVLLLLGMWLVVYF